MEKGLKKPFGTLGQNLFLKKVFYDKFGLPFEITGIINKEVDEYERAKTWRKNIEVRNEYNCSFHVENRGPQVSDVIITTLKNNEYFAYYSLYKHFKNKKKYIWWIENIKEAINKYKKNISETIKISISFDITQKQFSEIFLTYGKKRSDSDGYINPRDRRDKIENCSIL